MPPGTYRAWRGWRRSFFRKTLAVSKVISCGANDVQEFGRRQLHVGGLMPFFKGGLALSLAYYGGLLLALRRGARFIAEPFAAAAFFVVLLHALFLLQEGFFIMSVSFDLVMVGLCMGHLLSRQRAARRETT